MRLDSKVRGLVRAALMLMLPLTACVDSLLEVEDPDTVNPTTLEDPATAGLQIAGAVSDFQRAYSGGGLDDKFLSNTSLLTDEFFSTGTFTTRTATDRRNLFQPNDGNTHDGAYLQLHVARRALKDAVVFVAEVEPGNPAIAEMKGLEGYTYVALGEGFCGPIPFSDVIDNVRVDGAPVGTTEIFNQAITRFDAGIANDMAKVGKARALLNLGQFAAAASAVSGVSTSFVYFIEHSDNSGDQENPFFNLQSNGRYSQSDIEGINGLPYRSAGDPRTPWFEDPNRGFDPAFRLFTSLRYPTRSSSVVLADGIEARLIEAEADLDAERTGPWLAKLNALRADVANLMAARYEDYAENVPGATLAPLTDPGTAAGRVDLMFYERAFWLWGTGHRLGDMRRLVNQYGRAPGSVYPTGAYHKGGTFGTSVVFNLDFDEINNLLYDPSTCNIDSTS